MTTSACGWPKLSHRHCSRLLRLLGAVGRADLFASSLSCSQAPAIPSRGCTNRRICVLETRHSVSRPAPVPLSARRPRHVRPRQLFQQPGTAAEATPTSHHKTWQDLAQKHNEERARRQPQTSASLTPSSSAPKSSMSVAGPVGRRRVDRRDRTDPCPRPPLSPSCCRSSTNPCQTRSWRCSDGGISINDSRFCCSGSARGSWSSAHRRPGCRGSAS